MFLFAEITGEYEAVTEFAEPDAKLEEGDVVVGEMSDQLKRLFTVRSRVIQELEGLRDKLADIAEAKFGTRELESLSRSQHRELAETTEDLRLGSQSLRLKYRLINEIFWRSVEGEFPQLIDVSSGVRQGFKVVQIPEPEADCHCFGGIMIISHEGSMMN